MVEKNGESVRRKVAEKVHLGCLRGGGTKNFRRKKRKKRDWMGRDFWKKENGTRKSRKTQKRDAKEKSVKGKIKPPPLKEERHTIRKTGRVKNYTLKEEVWVTAVLFAREEQEGEQVVKLGEWPKCCGKKQRWETNMASSGL